MNELILSLEWRLDQLKRTPPSSLTPRQLARIEARLRELRNEIAFTISEVPA